MLLNTIPIVSYVQERSEAKRRAPTCQCCQLAKAGPEGPQAPEGGRPSHTTNKKFENYQNICVPVGGVPYGWAFLPPVPSAPPGRPSPKWQHRQVGANYVVLIESAKEILQLFCQFFINFAEIPSN